MACNGSLWSDKSQISLSSRHVELFVEGIHSLQRDLGERKHFLIASGASDQVVEEIEHQQNEVSSLLKSVNKVI